MGSVTGPSERRYVPVRVADVPLQKRMLAAVRVNEVEADPHVRTRIFELAIDPGDLVAWVRP